MLRSMRFYGLLAVVCVMALAACLQTVAQENGYTIKQITSGTNPHRWPAINNSGVIVWSEQDSSGTWHLMKWTPNGDSGSAHDISPSNSNLYQFRFPTIDDAGNVLCSAKHANVPMDHLVMYTAGGTEQVFAMSSQNRYFPYSHRDVGKYAGSSGGGTVV